MSAEFPQGNCEDQDTTTSNSSMTWLEIAQLITGARTWHPSEQLPDSQWDTPSTSGAAEQMSVLDIPRVHWERKDARDSLPTSLPSTSSDVSRDQNPDVTPLAPSDQLRPSDHRVTLVAPEQLIPAATWHPSEQLPDSQSDTPNTSGTAQLTVLDIPRVHWERKDARDSLPTSLPSTSSDVSRDQDPDVTPLMPSDQLRPSDHWATAVFIFKGNIGALEAAGPAPSVPLVNSLVIPSAASQPPLVHERKAKKPVPEEEKDEAYRLIRDRNNAAARKSRVNQKKKNEEIKKEAASLKKVNELMHRKYMLLLQRQQLIKLFATKRDAPLRGESMDDSLPMPDLGDPDLPLVITDGRLQVGNTDPQLHLAQQQQGKAQQRPVKKAKQSRKIQQQQEQQMQWQAMQQQQQQQQQQQLPQEPQQPQLLMILLPPQQQQHQPQYPG